MLTIGQMAALNRVSEQTLRLYDRMGLLKPYTTNKETGYRLYSIKQSARLDMIQYMKSLGMSLKDIKKHLDSRDFKLLRDVLERRSDQIDNQIEELNRQKKAVLRTMASYARYESSPPDGTIILEYIESRLIYLVDAGINFYDAPSAGPGGAAEASIEAYERMLRSLKESMALNNVPQIYFCNAGTILRKERLFGREFVSSEVFIFVDREFAAPSLTATVPGGAYMCMYCDSFEKEKEYALKLLRVIEDRGYEICGDYICEVIADLPVFENHVRGMFLRLQVPVKFEKKTK